jgi:hypothetical protein
VTDRMTRTLERQRRAALDSERERLELEHKKLELERRKFALEERKFVHSNGPFYARSRVRLEAGAYSGKYLVEDIGALVRGRRIDIWTPHQKSCKI